MRKNRAFFRKFAVRTVFEILDGFIKTNDFFKRVNNINFFCGYCTCFFLDLRDLRDFLHFFIEKNLYLGPYEQARTVSRNVSF